MYIENNETSFQLSFLTFDLVFDLLQLDSQLHIPSLASNHKQMCTVMHELYWIQHWLIYSHYIFSDHKVGASVGGSGSCSAERLAIAVIIPSIVFGAAGFFVGFLVSRKCTPHKPKNNERYNEESNHKKMENTYSGDPNQYVTSPPVQGGKIKIYHNPTKQCNLKVPNGSVEAIVETHKDNKVYV